MTASCEGPITREKVGNSPAVKSMATMSIAVSCEGPITREKVETHPL